MNDPLHGVAIYNPRLLSKGELIGFFVARQQELERLVTALRRESKAQPQHHLVVGARGMGKTTLLNRLLYAIEDDEELASRCIGVAFPEEQYNVVCSSDFWLNCVDALADGLESSGRMGLLEGIDEEIERVQALPRKDDRGRSALDLLCQLSDRLQRRLVLLVDNVDLVLDRLEDEQWALREVLSSEPRIQLIGATSAPLESQYRHDKAFYDFFRVHHLDGLDDEETFTVLRRLAEATGQDRVKRLIDEDPGRVKTVRLMAGGNPRTVVLLFNVLAQGTDGDVRSDIERLLDQCTPLYKHRLEALSTQAQQVLDALAKHWAPATASEIADATHLQVNVVSVQLDRLVRDGTVEKVSLPDTKRHGFQIAERFFNIWCLMRASRRVRRRLVWLVEFLRLVFGPERARKHLTVTTKPRGDGERHAELGLAFAALVEDRPLRTALETQSMRMLCVELVSRLKRMHMLAEARELVLSTQLELPGWSAERFWELMGGSWELIPEFKLPLAKAFHEDPKEVVTKLGAGFVEQQQLWASVLVPEEAEALARAVREGDIDMARLTRDELEAAALARGDRSLIPCALALHVLVGNRVSREWLDREIQGSRSILPRIQLARLARERNAPDEVPLGMPSGPRKSGMLDVATFFVARGEWMNAQRWAIRAFQVHDSGFFAEDWASVSRFITAMVEHDLTTESREILAAAGVRERWEPLDRALAIIEGKREGENAPTRLAVEMGEAVRLVLAQLSPESLAALTRPVRGRRRPRPTRKS